MDRRTTFQASYETIREFHASTRKVLESEMERQFVGTLFTSVTKSGTFARVQVGSFGTSIIPFVPMVCQFTAHAAL